MKIKILSEKKHAMQNFTHTSLCTPKQRNTNKMHSKNQNQHNRKHLLMWGFVFFFFKRVQTFLFSDCLSCFSYVLCSGVF